MRGALIVGIDNYPKSPLSGCEADATRVKTLLCRNDDGSPNFECKLILSSGASVTRARLREEIEKLFAIKAGVVLLYFAGHGTYNDLGGYLVTCDAQRYDEGVSLVDVLTWANKSGASERVIILDSCHSGALGQLPAFTEDGAILREGVSVLSACRDTESAVESKAGGLFTGLICDALEGGAADICGRVTVASLYAYVDQALGTWQQRPLFKSHVSKLIALRAAKPAVPLEILRQLPRYFKNTADALQLDPSYEPTAKPKDPEHEEVFGDLQLLRAARLIEPVDTDHMYYAAMNSKSCRLTALGRFYWNLANSGHL
jgi:Caspase domain